ncbi:MAG: helix-turn-helix domain-containing protein [Solirubrobacteraceae bacterium]|nr:helix-turn-helix domain-containing protein [Solirubrobacteraceae bacterium]
MDVARELRAARAAAGLSQAELAERSGTSQATLSAYERGRKQPTIATALRILRAADRDLVTLPAAAVAERRRLEDAGRTLVEVLDLAGHLPTRHDPVLGFPALPRRAPEPTR